MKTRTTLKSVAIAFAAIGTAFAPAAFATTANEVSVEIDTRYLETDWGVEMVYNKLSSKAETSCNARNTLGISARNAARDCMSNLLDDFVENVNHDGLTTYHSVAKS